MSRPAFTFVEMMAVVMLLGLLAGAVTWSMAETAQHASREQVVGSIVHLDRTTRLAGERLGGSYALRFDLDEQVIERLETSSGGESDSSRRLRLPGDHRIDRLRVAWGDLAASSGPGGAADRIDAGTVEIAFSSRGRSPTYAVRLVGANGGRGAPATGRNRRMDWIVFSGLTGQVMLDYEQERIDSLFDRLAGRGPDAD